MAKRILSRRKTSAKLMDLALSNDGRKIAGLRYRLAIETLVASISSRLIKAPAGGSMAELNLCLKEIGEFIQVDRCYIHLLSPEAVIIKSYEWQNPQTPAAVGSLVGVDLTPLKWALAQLKRGELVYAPRMADLPTEAAAEVEAWLRRGILSALAIPFILDGVLVGYFGLSSLSGERQWTQSEMRILRLVGEILLSYIARKKAEEALTSSEARYRKDINAQKGAELALRQIQAELEQRVVERTAEYQAALERLEKEASERKALEEALGETQVRFRKLVEIAPMSITITDLEGKLVWGNRYALELHGFTSMEELLGADSFSLIVPEDRPRAIENARLTLETGSIREIDYRVLRKDGSSFPAKISVSVIPGSHGEPRAFLGVVWDISEFKRAEAELQESQLRYQIISDLISDNAYVVKVGTDGSLTNEWLVDKISREIGYTPDNLSGFAWMSALHPEDKNKTIQHFSRVLRGETDVAEFRIVGTRGELRWLRNYARPVWDEESGRVVKIFGAAQDITERKAAEEAYRTLVNKSLQGLVILQTDKIAFINPTVETIFGYTAEEITSIPLDELVTKSTLEEDRVEYSQRMGRLVDKDTKESRGEYRLLDKLGCLHRIEIQAKPIQFQDSPAMQLVLLDVTERWRAEEAYRTLVNESLQGLAIFQADRIAFVNPAVEGMTGFKVEEILKMGIMDLLRRFNLPESKQNFRKLLQAVIANKVEAGHFELAMRHRDDSIRWFEMEAMPVQFHEKPALRAVFVDITERKHAEQAYWDLVEHSLQGLVVIQDETIVYVNPASERLVGMTKDEILQMTLREVFKQVILPEDRKNYIQTYQNNLDGNFSDHLSEGRLRHRDGSIRWVEVQITPTLYQGRPAIQDLILDITERKEAEAALRASEAAYRQQASELQVLYSTSIELNTQTEIEAVLQTILEQVVALSGATGGAILLHKNDSHRLAIRIATPELRNAVGHEIFPGEGVSGQVLQTGEAAYFPDDRSVNLPARVTQFSLSEVNFGAVLSIPMSSQQGRLGVLTIYKSLDDSGQQHEFSPEDKRVAELFAAQAALALEKARLLDETRRLYEREHQQRQELELSQKQLVQAEKMAALGRLTGTIAHNMGNPLQAAQLSLELAREEAQAASGSEKVEHYINIAAKQVESVSRVLNQFRQFYRTPPYNGQVGPGYQVGDFYSGFSFEKTSLPEVVRNVLDLIQYRFREAHVKAQVSEEPGLPPLLGVPDLLAQVVMNLALNACEAMEPGTGRQSSPSGSIFEIRMQMAELHPSEGPLRTVPAIQLEACDNGPGLPPEVHDRIFEPFVTTRLNGAGLGLASVYEIIRAHQGTIQVNSNSEQGTTFTILLPLEPYQPGDTAQTRMS